MSNEADCRTAPATPGLLITRQSSLYQPVFSARSKSQPVQQMSFSKAKLGVLHTAAPWAPNWKYNVTLIFRKILYFRYDKINPSSKSIFLVLTRFCPLYHWISHYNYWTVWLDFQIYLQELGTDGFAFLVTPNTITLSLTKYIYPEKADILNDKNLTQHDLRWK